MPNSFSLPPGQQPVLRCPICSHAMKPKLTSWSFYCDCCEYWGSTLKPVTAVLEQDEFLAKREDEDNPIDYLDELRITNFRTCLQHIARVKPSATSSILEVGCGAGLFLSEAAAIGIEAEGVEAYEAMARRGIAQGRPIRIGFFPDCLGVHERFGVIVFNDVFEHLPDASAMLLTCARHLQPDGLLVLNLPNSRGLFYRVAALALSVGIRSPWERLWQKMFFTPHLHYFSPKSLELLCHNAGFDPATPTIGLKSVSIRGLWKRIKADSTMSKLQGIAVFATTLFLACLVPFFESDCTLRIFRRVT